MDSTPPLGKDTGPSPKQLLLMSIAGCTAMDVVALLKKHKQAFERFEMRAQGELTAQHPKVFQSVELTYELAGPIDRERVIEAVRLSMTQYCGVSAMIAKACPIKYIIRINGEQVARDEARF
jgi:putative redox protein